jgi:hypothetical protein
MGSTAVISTCRLSAEDKPAALSLFPFAVPTQQYVEPRRCFLRRLTGEEKTMVPVSGPKLFVVISQDQ